MHPPSTESRHPFTSGLMLHYRKDIEALIGIIGCQDHRVKAMELEQNLTTSIKGNKGA